MHCIYSRIAHSIRFTYYETYRPLVEPSIYFISRYLFIVCMNRKFILFLFQFGVSILLLLVLSFLIHNVNSTSSPHNTVHCCCCFIPLCNARKLQHVVKSLCLICFGESNIISFRSFDSNVCCWILHSTIAERCAQGHPNTSEPTSTCHSKLNCNSLKKKKWLSIQNISTDNNRNSSSGWDSSSMWQLLHRI